MTCSMFSKKCTPMGYSVLYVCVLCYNTNSVGIWLFILVRGNSRACMWGRQVQLSHVLSFINQTHFYSQPNQGMAIGSKTLETMKQKFFYTLLALIAAVWLLPQSMWAQGQAFITMKVNNGEIFDADNATYDLIYDYGTKPTSDLMEDGNVVGKYYDFGEKENGVPKWTGWVSEGSVSPLWVSSNYKRANKVTYAELTDAFIANYHPQSCGYMFIGCRQITSIKNIEYLKTDQATSMERMFHYCKKLESLDLNQWDVSNCQSIAHIFRECTGLKHLNVSNWNTSNVSTANAAFSGCASLQTINVRGWDVSNFNTFAEIFYQCGSLKELDLSLWENNKITSAAALFGGLAQLEVLDISNLNTSNVTSIFKMFASDTKLKTIYVGNGWDMSKVTQSTPKQNMYGDWSNAFSEAFLNCTNLVGGNGTTYAQFYSACEANPNMEQGTPHANFPDNQPSANMRVRLSIENLNYARPDGQDGLPGLLTSTKAFAVVHDDGAGNVTLYLCNRGASDVKSTSFKPVVPAGDPEIEFTTGLTVIDNLSTMGENKWNLHALLEAAGVDVSTIDNVVIESSFGYMRPTTCEAWFSGMTNATISGLENLNTTECTSMKDMFKGTNFTALDFSTADMKLTFKTSNVTDMSGMFQDCSALTSVTFGSNFSTANVTTMKDMFSGCSSLTDIATLTEYFNTIKVTDMSGMFQGCSSLKANKYDEQDNLVELNLATFYTSGVTTMENMFKGCTSIKQLNISSFGTPNVTKMAGMFQGDSQLKTIIVDLTFNADKVIDSGDHGTDMFLGCESIVGGDNQKYEPSATDAGYAHIDESTDPGYLTEVAPVECYFYGDAAHDNTATLMGYDGKTGIVHIRRTFTAGQWTSICLPIDVTTKQLASIFGAATQLKTLSGDTRSGDKVNAITLADATSIEAGKPYLILPAQKPTYSENGKTYDGFRLSHKLVIGTPVSVSKNGFSMRGTFNPATLAVSTDTYTVKENQTGTPSLSTLSAVSKETELPALQVYFTDMKVSDYTLTVGSEGVATLYLPYAVEIPDANYFVPCIVTNISIDSWDYSAGTATMKRIKQGVIPANTGVIINANPGTYTMCVTDQETDEDLSGNWLKGVTEDTRTVDIEYNNNFVDADNDGIDDNDADPYYSIFTAKRGVETSIGFYYKTAHSWVTGKNDTSSTVAANRAFIRVLDSNLTPAAKERGFILVDEDNATGIEDVETAGKKTSDGVYYNLNGQRVAAPAKGIYIKDGKKVYVK